MKTNALIVIEKMSTLLFKETESDQKQYLENFAFLMNLIESHHDLIDFCPWLHFANKLTDYFKQFKHKSILLNVSS